MKNQAALVRDWNERFSIGTAVIWHKLINPNREPVKSKTRSDAFLMGGHSAVILVDGHAGGVALDGVVIDAEVQGVSFGFYPDAKTVEEHAANCRFQLENVEGFLMMAKDRQEAHSIAAAVKARCLLESAALLIVAFEASARAEKEKSK